MAAVAADSAAVDLAEAITIITAPITTDLITAAGAGADRYSFSAVAADLAELYSR